jgi:hypothetical protein
MELLTNHKDKNALELAFAYLEQQAELSLRDQQHTVELLKLDNKLLQHKLCTAAATSYRLQGLLHPRGLLELAESKYKRENPGQRTRLQLWEAILLDEPQLCQDVARVCRLKEHPNVTDVKGKVKKMQLLAAEVMWKLYHRTSDHLHAESQAGSAEEIVIYKDLLITEEVEVLKLLCVQADLPYVVKVYAGGKPSTGSAGDEPCDLDVPQ